MEEARYSLNYEVVADVLSTIVVLSLFIERALALLFQHRLFLDKLDKKGLKEPIAFIVSLLVVKQWGFDAMAAIIDGAQASWWGYALTAGIVAGGSKGAVALFQDYLGWSSRRKIEQDEIDKAVAEARKQQVVAQAIATAVGKP
jgi:hypothetical protein